MKIQFHDHRKWHHLIILVLLGSISLTSFTYALNTVSTGYKVETVFKEIDAHGNCQLVKSNNSTDYFVPTKTSSEWSTFLANRPSNTTVAACPPAPGATNDSSAILVVRAEGCRWNANGTYDELYNYVTIPKGNYTYDPPGCLRGYNTVKWTGELVNGRAYTYLLYTTGEQTGYNRTMYTSSGNVSIGSRGYNQGTWPTTTSFTFNLSLLESPTTAQPYYSNSFVYNGATSVIGPYNYQSIGSGTLNGSDVGKGGYALWVWEKDTVDAWLAMPKWEIAGTGGANCTTLGAAWTGVGQFCPTSGQQCTITTTVKGVPSTTHYRCQ